MSHHIVSDQTHKMPKSTTTTLNRLALGSFEVVAKSFFLAAVIFNQFKDLKAVGKIFLPVLYRKYE